MTDDADRRWTRARESLMAEGADPATPASRVLEIWTALMVAADAPITTDEAIAVLERVVRRPS